MFSAYPVKNFISKEDCEYLVNSVKNIEFWESGGNDFWDNRVLNISTLYNIDNKSARIVTNAIDRTQVKIKELYNLDYDVYADTLQVIRWFDGSEQMPHADDMIDAGVEGFSHRLYGAIIYLNKDFLGGATYYSNTNNIIVPEVGKLAVHPGDSEHTHGVTRVRNGIRYTIASFWTKEKERAYDYSLYK